MSETHALSQDRFASPRVTQAGDRACAPSWRLALAIGGVAVGLRVVVFLLASWRLDLSASGYARLYDGESYLVMARAMLGDTAGFNGYHARMFAGFPAFIAAVHRLTGLSLEAAALAINWVSAGLAAAFAARLFRDWRVGCATAVLVPHYLMNSTMAMSEALLLALSTGGLLLGGGARDGAPAWRAACSAIAGGVLLGTAGLVRPMACFAVLGGVVWLATRRRVLSAMLLAAAAAGVVGLGMLGMHLWRGDALLALRSQADYGYGGQIVSWPFHSLLTTPSVRPSPAWRVAYIWAHVVLALVACVAAARALRLARPGRDLAFLAAPWLLANTLFVLCVGNVWGFECFHRFLVPALPALFWPVRRVLPSGGAAWAVVAAGSAALAVFSVGAG